VGVIGASQDANREVITLIVSIFADASHVTPALIYKGTSHDLQDTWLDKFDAVQVQAFANSENSWSFNLLG
jgi:hypothetical protein